MRKKALHMSLVVLILVVSTSPTLPAEADPGLPPEGTHLARIELPGYGLTTPFTKSWVINETGDLYIFEKVAPEIEATFPGWTLDPGDPIAKELDQGETNLLFFTHRGWFIDLDDLEVGDKVTIYPTYDLNGPRYTATVLWKRIVPQDQGGLLLKNTEVPVVTLVTSNPDPQDPEAEFTPTLLILRAVFEPPRYEHRVSEGDTLSAIAKRYGATVGAIAAYNGIVNPDFIREGEKLFVP